MITPKWATNLRRLGGRRMGRDRSPVDAHQNLIVLVRRILHLILSAGFLSHGPYLLGMIPGPLHFYRQVVCIARCEVQSGVPIFNDFLHRPKAGTDDRSTASEGFGNGHRKVLIPTAREDQETCPFYSS